MAIYFLNNYFLHSHLIQYFLKGGNKPNILRVSKEASDICMAFQVARCLVFASKTDRDVSFEDLLNLVQRNIDDSVIDNKSLLPTPHPKVCEMGFHTFQSAIIKLTSEAVMPQRVCTGSIMGTLIYDEVKDKGYRYFK